MVIAPTAEPVGSCEQVGLGVSVLAAVGRVRVAAANVSAVEGVLENIHRWQDPKIQMIIIFRYSLI